jgi:hypothetical protein
MSYWTYMQIDTGGEHAAIVDEIGNMTSNVSAIWTDAMGVHLRELDGKLGSELIPIIEPAVAKLKDPSNHDRYRAMEPSNGWGSLQGATEYLERILEGCRNHPKAHLHVSG